MKHLPMCGMCGLAALCLVTIATPAYAGTPPILDFDIPVLVECKDVTTASFAAKYPDKKLVEIKFDVTSTLSRGQESDLQSVTYSMGLLGSSPIVDFLPKTRLEAEIAGPISVVEEKASDASATLKVGYSVGPLRGEGEIGAGTKKHSQVSYEKLPAQNLVLAAGKDDGGTSATFDLRPSNQATMLGEKEYAVICEVPHGWRGGFGRVSLLAKGTDRGVVYDSTVPSGLRFGLCFVYMEGDNELKTLAERLSGGVTTLNADLSPRMDVVQANAVAVFSTTKYSPEDDISRLRTSAALVTGLAGYYYMSQSALTPVTDKEQKGAWDSEVATLNKTLDADGALGKRGFKAAFRVLRGAEKLISLHDKCFRPTLFDAEGYKNDCNQEEEMLRALPD